MINNNNEELNIGDEVELRSISFNFVHLFNELILEIWTPPRIIFLRFLHVSKTEISFTLIPLK